VALYQARAGDPGGGVRPEARVGGEHVLGNVLGIVLGNVLQRQGRLDEAMAYERALVIKEVACGQDTRRW